MSSKYCHLQCFTDMLLIAITVSLAGVWQGLKQVLVAGADRLCESCGEQGDAALAIMEGIL